MIGGMGCYLNPEIEEKLLNIGENTTEISTFTETENQESESTQENPFYPDINYPEVDGLHVTGLPIEIDIEVYRLKIKGLVEKELEFTFNEIKNMPAERIFAILNCPGFFVDEGYWTGVKLIDLLDTAIVKSEAKTVTFIEEGGGYSQNIPLQKIYSNPEDYIIAYYFNDKEFPEIHGYPLRVVARIEPGSIWVKWLAEIRLWE
jgi:DMSO/TMAO reductase YedYZ molybdopterin-dependent catalytic subunit